MDWDAVISQFGIAGVIIAGLVWDRLRILQENKELQDEVRDLFRENVETLKTLATSIKQLANTEKGRD